MSACENTQAELSAYLDDELREAERVACEAHLSECDNCRAVLEDLKAASAAVSGLPRLKASSDLAARLREEVLVRPVPQDFSAFDKSPAPLAAAEYSPWRPVLFGIAALVMLCVMGFLTLPALSYRPGSRTALVGGTRKPPVVRAPSATGGTPMAKAMPAAEFPGRADNGAANSEPAAARPEALAKDKETGNRELEPAAPAAPAAPFAAQPAPAPPSAPSALVKLKAPEVARAPEEGKLPAPAKGLEGAGLRRGTGLAPKEAPEPGQALEQGRQELADQVQGGGNIAYKQKGEAQKEKSAGAMAGKLGADGGARQEDASKQAFAGQQKLAPTQDGTLAVAQQRSRQLADEGQKKLAAGAMEKSPAKSGAGGAGGVNFGAKAAPPGNGAAFEKQAAEEAVAPGRPSRAVANVEVPEVRTQGAAGQAKGAATPGLVGKGIGGGGAVAAYQLAAPEEVLVFRSQDRDRLLTQLRELAAQNGARLELAEAQANRNLAPFRFKGEDKEAQQRAEKTEPAARVDCEIVTAPGQQRRDILAKLRELQGVSLGVGVDHLQSSIEDLRNQLAQNAPAARPAPTAGARRGTAPAAEEGAVAEQEAKPAEAKQSESANRPERQVVRPSVQTQPPPGRLEVRIPIRIEIINQ